jgi:hypothetical protein
MDNTMKRSIVILFFMTLVSYANCQIAIPETNSNNNTIEETPLKKVDYSLNTGTSFSTGAYSGSSYYIAPEMTYRFSPKFKVHTSIAFINSNISAPSASYLNFGDNQSRLFDKKTNQTVVYASGDYQINTRLMITGTVIKNFNSLGNSKQQNAGWNNSFQMMSLGMLYKITPNMTIGADFKMIQGDNLYNNPLYYNSLQSTSPFYNFR